MFLAIQVAVILGVFVLLCAQHRKDSNLSLAFLSFALWLRFSLSALHTFTYAGVVGGLSINALASIAVTMVAIYLCGASVFRLKGLVSFYLFLMVVVASAAINGEVSGLIVVMMKWMYFLGLSLLIYQSLKTFGHYRVASVMLLPFLVPVVLQIFSIALGVSKGTESDGSASFIGGYNHEAAFSMMLIAMLFVVGILGRDIRFRTLWMLLGAVLLIFANYRTSMIGILPMLMLYACHKYTSRIDVKDKVFSGVFGVVVVICFLILVSDSISSRFTDFNALLSQGGSLIAAPIYYTDEAQDLFSARLYLWSQYLTAYGQSGLLAHVIGFGPESWQGVFEKYAHNTYVSYLYEFGIFGLSVFLFFLSAMAVQLIKCRNVFDSSYALSALIGFLILNLATMPLWNIEGLIAFSVIFGQSLYASSVRYAVQFRRESESWASASH